MTNKEKTIQFIIDRYNNSNTNPIRINNEDVNDLQISEKEVIQILNTLHEDDLIFTKPRSIHKDFSLYWDITLNTECLEYFYNKNRAKTLDRRDIIKTYIPIALSVISIIISIIALIISV